MSKRLLIVGCGYVGEELARQAFLRGDQVWGLRRSHSQLPSGVRAIQADVVSGEGFPEIPEELDWVVYAVGASDHSEVAYEAAYVRGIENLLLHLVKQSVPPKRIVFVSSTGVYGQNSGEWVDEGSTTEPTHFSGRLLLQGEKLVRQSTLPSVILRFGGIYGPNRVFLLKQMVNASSYPNPQEAHFTNRVHRDDCASMILHLLSKEQVSPLYLGVDDDPASRNALYAWVSKQLGRELSSWPENENTRQTGKRCRNDLLKQSGYRFLYPTFREGYSSLLSAASLG